jgi:hypothetical protein
MKMKEYIIMLLFDLQNNRKILSSLAEIKNNINKHIKIGKESIT